MELNKNKSNFKKKTLKKINYPKDKKIIQKNLNIEKKIGKNIY